MLSTSALRVVFVSSNNIEANLVKSLLEGSGIEVFILDENVGNYLYAGGVKLAVTPGQEQLARVVLQEYRGKEGQSPTNGSNTPVSL
jgi:hypothetical protein